MHRFLVIWYGNNKISENFGYLTEYDIHSIKFLAMLRNFTCFSIYNKEIYFFRIRFYEWMQNNHSTEQNYLVLFYQKWIFLFFIEHIPKNC